MFPFLKLQPSSLDTLHYHFRYPDMHCSNVPQTSLMEFLMRASYINKIENREEMQEFLFRVNYLFPELEMPFNYVNFKLYFAFDGLKFFKPKDLIAHLGIRLDDQQQVDRKTFLEPMREVTRNNAFAMGRSTGFCPVFDFIDLYDEEGKRTLMGIKRINEPETREIQMHKRMALFLTNEIFKIKKETIYGVI